MLSESYDLDTYAARGFTVADGCLDLGDSPDAATYRADFRVLATTVRAAVADARLRPLIPHYSRFSEVFRRCARAVVTGQVTDVGDAYYGTFSAALSRAVTGRLTEEPRRRSAADQEFSARLAGRHDRHLLQVDAGRQGGDEPHRLRRVPRRQPLRSPAGALQPRLDVPWSVTWSSELGAERCPARSPRPARPWRPAQRAGAGTGGWRTRVVPVDGEAGQDVPGRDRRRW